MKIFNKIKDFGKSALESFSFNNKNVNKKKIVNQITTELYNITNENNKNIDFSFFENSVNQILTIQEKNIRFLKRFFILFIVFEIFIVFVFYQNFLYFVCLSLFYK